MKQKLTLANINSAKAQKCRYVLWDTAIHGFGVRVNADETKTYVLKYMRAGRQRWYTIGRHGAPWTPDQARKQAIKLLGRVHDGQDPAQCKVEERASACRIEDLCRDYIEALAAGAIISRSGRSKRPSTVSTDRGRIERHIIPLLGTKVVKEVTRRDIEGFRDAVAAGKTATSVKTKPRGRAIVRGGQGTATRTLGLLGGIFSFAVSQGMRPDNPVHGVRRFKDRPKQRYLSEGEIGRLAKACDDAERGWHEFDQAYNEWLSSGRPGPAPACDPRAENPYAVAAIRLLLLTGMRKGEALSLRWDWVAPQRSVFNLPDSKTSERTIPVGTEVIKLIGSIPRQLENPFIFCGQKRDAHLVGLPKVWLRLRAAADLHDVRLHDLRHTFASYGAAAGLSLFLLGRMLGHVLLGRMLGHADTKTTARYAHLDDNPLISGANRIANGIAGLMAA